MFPPFNFSKVWNMKITWRDFLSGLIKTITLSFIYFGCKSGFIWFTIKKYVGNVKMKSYLEEKLKTHIMKTRHSDFFEVTLAHTQRLQSSPIIHMQRLLNDTLRSWKLMEILVQFIINSDLLCCDRIKSGWWTRLEVEPKS